MDRIVLSRLKLCSCIYVLCLLHICHYHINVNVQYMYWFSGRILSLSGT